MPLIVEEYVQTLDISMNDILRVKVLHGLTDLIGEIPYVLFAEILAAGPLIFKHAVEVPLFRIFHHNVYGILFDERIVVPIVCFSVAVSYLIMCGWSRFFKICTSLCAAC